MDLDYRRYPVLVVDDEPDILRALVLSYGDIFNIVSAESGLGGLELLRTHEVAVIVADQRMPSMTGTEFLERSMEICPHAVRIILTGYSDNEAIIRAINYSGIYRYLTKPWDTDELRLTIRRAIEVHHLERENARLVDELRLANERLASQNQYLRKATIPNRHEIAGESAAIRGVLAKVEKVAGSPTTVLIQGETGTGKELVARAIHASSPRAEELFVAVNCSELAEGVLESELFGHRRGAFTGAIADRKGLFEVADGGTLFLDEICETTLALQSKLLRVLQEREVRPVGSAKPLPVDVRIIAATNRRVEDEVKAGRFREDLYYRLCVFPIAVPPLRERMEDIPLLARHLVDRLAARLNKRVGDLTPEAIDLLCRYPFPGNVRQLENEIERAILLAEPGAPLSDDLLSDRIQEVEGSSDLPGALRRRTDEFERDQINAVLARTSGVRIRAAEELGLTARGLAKKMHRLGMG